MSDVLSRAERFLREEVAPKAAQIDKNESDLRTALHGLGRESLLALKRPVEYGGPALSEPEFRSFQVAVARASGALAFLQTQHQSAASLIAKGSNESLKKRVLPLMSDGSRLIGVGFSQLRRPGKPVVTAEECPGGYRLNGRVPWVTGEGYFHDFLVAGELPDGTAVFGLMPLGETEGARLSPRMKLATFEVANTVAVELEDYVVREEDVAGVRPRGWIQENDMLNVVLQGYFALGCALAGADVVGQMAERKESARLHAAQAQLMASVERLRADMDEVASADVDAQTKLRARARAIALAARSAHAAVAAGGGGSIGSDAPGQRIFREAMVYTVSAQTPEILEATLDELLGPG